MKKIWVILVVCAGGIACGDSTSDSDIRTDSSYTVPLSRDSIYDMDSGILDTSHMNRSIDTTSYNRGM